MKGWTPGAVYLCGLGYSTAIVILVGTWLVQTRAEWPTIRGTEPILSSWPNQTLPAEPRAVKAAPRFARESSRMGGEASMAHAQGERPEPGLAASPGGRAGAYPSSRTIERVIASCGVCGVPVGIGMRLVARESGFRQFDSRGRLLVSSAGAVGIGQIKPSSAAEVSPTLDIRDEWQNLVASMCYLSSRRGTWREKVLAYRVGASGIRTAAAHAYASHVMGSK